MKELIRLENLQIKLKEGKNRFCAVNGVSLSLQQGKALGIIGESGCGKTLLCRSLFGILEQEKWEIEGIVRMDRTNAGFIAQDPAGAFDPRMKLKSHFLEMSGVLSMNRKEILERARHLLDRMGIREPERVLNSYAFQLSGGMLQRVMIALALLGKPDILVADEPTTALDVTTQWEILGLLNELGQEYGLTVLIVSHDLKVIREIADEICVMYAGYVVEQGTVQEVLETPLHPYTRGLLASRPAFSKKTVPAMEGCPPGIREKPPGCPFAPRCAQAAEICHRSCPPLQNVQETEKPRKEPGMPKNTANIRSVRCFAANAQMNGCR